jgi:hypothetical protein
LAGHRRVLVRHISLSALQAICGARQYPIQSNSPIEIGPKTVSDPSFFHNFATEIRARRMGRDVRRSAMRQAHSQIVEREELRDTAEDHEYRNGEIHHATVNTLASSFHPQCHLVELLPSSRKLRGQLTRCRRSPWRNYWRDVGTAVWRPCAGTRRRVDWGLVMEMTAVQIVECEVWCCATLRCRERQPSSTLGRHSLAGLIGYSLARGSSPRSPRPRVYSSKEGSHRCLNE